MSATIIRFVDLLLVALLAGAIFGIWIGFNPAGLSPATYVEQRQNSSGDRSTLPADFGGALPPSSPRVGSAVQPHVRCLAVSTRWDPLHSS